jgi:hypothetical protein
VIAPFSLPRRRALRSGVCLATGLAAACADSSAPAPKFVGHYTLAGVDGHSLPASYSCGARSVSAGQLTITADSVWFERTEPTSPGTVTIAERGSYERSPDGQVLVVSYAADLPWRDSVAARGGIWLSLRGGVPVSATCTGYSSARANFSFVRD